MDAAYVAGKDSRMKYFGGCDAGSTYTKCVIIDENGKILAAVTKRSRINPVLSAKDALDEAVSQVDGLNSAEELTYLIGTGYGRNKVPFADENISEISCHAMGVHVTDPSVKAIIDIGGQDVKGIAIDTEKPMLDHARLCIGTIKDGDLFSLHPFPYQVIDFFQNPLHFVQIGRRFTNPDRFPFTGIGMQVLAQTVPVVCDQGIGRFEDIAV